MRGQNHVFSFRNRTENAENFIATLTTAYGIGGRTVKLLDRNTLSSVSQTWWGSPGREWKGPEERRELSSLPPSKDYINFGLSVYVLPIH